MPDGKTAAPTWLNWLIGVTLAIGFCVATWVAIGVLLRRRQILEPEHAAKHPSKDGEDDAAA